MSTAAATLASVASMNVWPSTLWQAKNPLQVFGPGLEAIPEDETRPFPAHKAVIFEVVQRHKLIPPF